MIISSSLENYWKEFGYDRFGMCLTDNKTLFYVNIPKNASTFVKQNLDNLGWEYQNYYDHNIKERLRALVILRDPISRWATGIDQYFSLYHKDVKILTDTHIDIVCNKIVMDDHTEKQVYFLRNLNTDNCIFLKLDAELSDNLSYIISDICNISINLIEDQFRYIKKPIAAQLLRLLEERPVLKQKIKNFYSADYELIENIKFYNAKNN